MSLMTEERTGCSGSRTHARRALITSNNNSMARRMHACRGTGVAHRGRGPQCPIPVGFFTHSDTHTTISVIPTLVYYDTN